jgi:glycosyltransferase involved in cell wall biosynthesis
MREGASTDAPYRRTAVGRSMTAFLPGPTDSSSAMLDIVAIPDTPWDRVVWTNRQHIMLRLPQVDPKARVLYVAPPRLLGRRLLGRRLAAQRAPGHAHPSLWTTAVAERVWVVQPLLPLPHRVIRRLAPKLVDRFMLAVARRAARKLGFSSPCVWTYTPLYEPHLGAFAERCVVYDVVDDYAAMPYYRRVAGSSVADLDRNLTRRADLVFVVNEYLHGQRSEWNARCHFVGNAGDVHLFAEARTSPRAPDDVAHLPTPRIGFHGTLTGDKLNVPLVGEVARRRPEWTFVLIGPDKDRSVRRELGRLPNVHFLGPRRAAALPPYLAAFDVLLIPYRRTAFTGRPLKVYEALAAGVPVVATGLPELAGEPGVSVADSNVEELESAIARVLAEDRPQVPLDSVAGYSWESKALRQWRLVHELVSKGADA